MNGKIDDIDIILEILGRIEDLLRDILNKLS